MNSLLFSLLDLPSPSNQVVINSLDNFVNDGTKIILESGKLPLSWEFMLNIPFNFNDKKVSMLVNKVEMLNSESQQSYLNLQLSILNSCFSSLIT